MNKLTWLLLTCFYLFLFYQMGCVVKENPQKELRSFRQKLKRSQKRYTVAKKIEDKLEKKRKERQKKFDDLKKSHFRKISRRKKMFEKMSKSMVSQMKSVRKMMMLYRKKRVK